MFVDKVIDYWFVREFSDEEHMEPRLCVHMVNGENFEAQIVTGTEATLILSKMVEEPNERA